MGYTPPVEIIIGLPAINRDTHIGDNYTYIQLGGTANASGKITEIQIHASVSLVNCEVATFFKVSGDNYSTRDTHTIGAVASGATRTFQVDLDVQAGDYIGVFYTAGEIDADSEGGEAYMWRSGDNIPCNNVSFTLYTYFPTLAFSLYGTGDTGEGELTIGEAFSMADSLVKNVIKQLSEAWSLADSWAAKIDLAESFSVVDSKVTSAIKALAESFSIAGSFTWSIVLHLYETISVKDSFTTFLKSLWHKVTKTVSDYTKVDKPTKEAKEMTWKKIGDLTWADLANTTWKSWVYWIVSGWIKVEKDTDDWGKVKK